MLSLIVVAVATAVLTYSSDRHITGHGATVRRLAAAPPKGKRRRRASEAAGYRGLLSGQLGSLRLREGADCWKPRSIGPPAPAMLHRPVLAGYGSHVTHGNGCR
jgi:hypothetical protein